MTKDPLAGVFLIRNSGTMSEARGAVYRRPIVNSTSREAHARSWRHNSHGGVRGADSLKLEQLLYEGLADALVAGRSAMERGDAPAKRAAVRKAVGIIDALRANQAPERGGETAANLGQLYDYMSRELTRASREDDLSALVAVINVTGTLRGGRSEGPETTSDGIIAA